MHPSALQSLAILQNGYLWKYNGKIYEDLLSRNKSAIGYIIVSSTIM